MELIATAVCLALIFALFQLVRNPSARISGAVWIPSMWLFLAGSRPVSGWLDDQPSMTNQMYNGNPIEATLTESLLVAGIIVVARRQPRVTAIVKNNWPVLAFFAYCLLSVGWSDFSSIAFKRWFKLLGDLVMVLIVLTDDHPIAAAKTAIARSGFFLLPLSVLLIKFYPGIGQTFGGELGMAMYVGVTTNKNELGMISMIWGLGFLGCFLDTFRKEGLDRSPKASRIAYLALVGIAVWLVVISNSATSLSCLELGSILLLLTSLRLISKRKWLVLALSMVTVAIPLIVVFVLPNLLSTVGRNATLTGRTDVWTLVKQMANNRLVGTGFDSFWLGWRLDRMWRMYWFHPIEAHEGYLDIWLNLGWIGIAFLAAMVLRGYWRVVGAVRQRVPMSSLGLTYIGVALIFNLTESAFHQVHPVWIFLLAAITAAPAVPALTGPTQVQSEPALEEYEDPEKEHWFLPQLEPRAFIVFTAHNPNQGKRDSFGSPLNGLNLKAVH